MFDILLYTIFPYAAIALSVVVTLQRYLRRGFTFTSLSSQFLESNELFYGSVAWHYGILTVLTGHLIGFLFPGEVLWFNGVPARLYILETTGLLFGLLALVGMAALLVRRITSARIRAVTTVMDIAVVVLLLGQVALGVYIAIFNRWGSNWYAWSAVPYLRSLLVFQPDMASIAPLPTTVKLHIVGAVLLVALLPFSRLVHLLIVPIQYLWRPYQIVIWNRNRRRLPAEGGARGAARPVVARSSADRRVAVDGRDGKDAGAVRPVVEMLRPTVEIESVEADTTQEGTHEYREVMR